MEYTITTRQENDQFYAVCKEIPEIGEYRFSSKEELDKTIYTVFAFVLEHKYRREGKPVPLPLGIDDSDDVIDVDGVLQAKILLWNYLVKEDLTASWLARRADMNRQSVQKIIDFSKSSSFAKVEELLHALGLVAHVTIEKF